MKMNLRLVGNIAILGCLLSVSSAFAQKKVAPKRKPAPAAGMAKPAPAPAPAAEAPVSGSTPEESSSAAPAAAPAPAAGYRASYGMAGCGLGSLVFSSPSQQNSPWLQVVAVTLNGTGYQTFGLTTGTSNCGGSSAGQARLEQEIFVSSNLNSLSKEAARGQGSSLSAFAEVLGCDVDAAASFAKMSQENYSSIFNSEEPKQVLNNYLGALHSNPGMNGKCTRA